MAIYEVVQMHDSTDTTKLQFPKVPLEAIIQDPDHRSAPFGTPARVMELLSMSSTAPTPTKADQHYFNTSTRKIHTSSASGSSFVWDTNGSEPQAGILYKVAGSGNSSEGDTLYVKSIDAQGEGLHLLGIWQYSGPFRAVGVRSGTTWVVAVEAGALVLAEPARRNVHAARRQAPAELLQALAELSAELVEFLLADDLGAARAGRHRRCGIPLFRPG